MRIKYILLWVVSGLILTSGCAAVLRVTRLRTLELDGKTVKAEEIQIDEVSRSLPLGEKLIYDVSWLGIPVGEITSTIKQVQKINGNNTYRIELVAKTNKFCSAFYPVNSKYVSYMDIKDLVSLRQEVSRREGAFKKDAITNFDQKNHRAHFKNFLDNSEKSFPIPPDTQDILTAIYYLRTVNVDVGDRINYEVVASEKVYSLYSLVEKREFIRIRDVGTFKSFLVRPYLKLGDGGNKRVRKTKVSGYFSADSSRIPLVVVVKGPVFTKVTVSLSKIDNIQQYEKENQ